MEHQKQLFMIGGPNGAGKTTSAFLMMPELVHCYEYINADAIAASLSPFNPGMIAIKSGKIMITRINELIQQNKNFAFEATMSSKNFANLLNKCKHLGYQINILFVWIVSYELAIQRVNKRTEAGGHTIPEDIVKRRYFRSVINFQEIYMDIADRWILCDNSTSEPIVVAQKYQRYPSIEIYDDELWQNFDEVSQ